MDVQVRFESRRSPVYCRSGCVACSQPLAAEIGVEVLKNGGNAADAAVAVAAALNVTEPCSTGIGGDCFCLFYDARSKTVQGINGRQAWEERLLLKASMCTCTARVYYDNKVRFSCAVAKRQTRITSLCLYLFIYFCPVILFALQWKSSCKFNS